MRATDPGSGIASFTVTGISNEPSEGDDDVVITGTQLERHVVWLRTERQASGGGRVYTLTASAIDVAGNSTSSRVMGVVSPRQGPATRPTN